MTPATALPDVLSPSAHEFASREHRLLIGGEWVAAATGSSFETVDPATDRPITSVAHAGPEDVSRAVAVAERALGDPAWRRISAADRSRWLGRLADLIETHADELAELESLDNGKPLRLARIVDVASAIAHFRHFAGWPERIQGTTIPVRAPEMLCYTRKEPVGVCARSFRGTSRC